MAKVDERLRKSHHLITSLILHTRKYHHGKHTYIKPRTYIHSDTLKQSHTFSLSRKKTEVYRIQTQQQQLFEMAAYHLEALRRQRVIDRKQGALCRIQQVSKEAINKRHSVILISSDISRCVLILLNIIFWKPFPISQRRLLPGFRFSWSVFCTKRGPKDHHSGSSRAEHL